MGHSVQFYKFNENESKQRIQAVADEDAIYGSDMRRELDASIRFIEGKVHENEDSARDEIERIDSGWYDQLAVKFHHYEERKETKAIENLRERIDKQSTELMNYREENSIKNRKSKFVGCEECGSKINKEYVDDIYSHYWNRCPLCKSDLSSNTIKQSVSNKTNKINDMRDKLERDIKDNNEKGKHKVMWLVKTEYHE